MSEQAQRQMPRYRCHKEVWALEILDINPVPEGWRLSFVDKEYATRLVSREWFNKHARDDEDLVGGYFVVYQDGYESWSPRQAFLSGYTLISNGSERT